MAPPATSTGLEARQGSHARKRTRTDDADEYEKKETKKRCFKDEESVREQARKHRILTARMPIEALTSTWSLGKNRRLDMKHVRNLCAIFTQGGLNRKAEEHHLLVLCSKADVTRMLEHLQRRNGRVSPSTPDNPPFFKEWLSVNRGKLAEIMAGQHRAKALEAYVRETGATEDERWWTCEFYDKDTLPLDLNLKLRVNRQDPAMADSHGQVWMQVVAASSQDPKLFHGKAVEVEEQMIDVLQLGSEKQFPTRRLATIWRNERWRAMATRWCETSVGRATFKISAWDWMISYRIDDYWFTTFRSVLHTLSQLPGDAANNVELTDWKKMSEFLGSTRTDDQVRSLFYPTAPSSSSSSTSSVSAIIDHTTKRRTGFLSAIDDLGYHELYKRIAGTRRLRFPDIHHIAGLSKEEGKVLFQVMGHIVAWLNSKPTAVFNRRDNNKPPLRADLETALGRCSDQFNRAAETRLDILVWDSDHPLSAPKTASILLQQEVLDFVLKHLTDFRNAAAKSYLDQLPNEVDCAQYTKRFLHKTWNGVLKIVRQWVGDDFHSEWMQSPNSDHVESHARVHADESEASPSTALSLTSSFRDIIKDDPELGRDFVLLEKLNSRSFEAALAKLFAQQQGRHHHHHHHHHQPGGGRERVTETDAPAMVLSDDEVDHPKTTAGFTRSEPLQGYGAAGGSGQGEQGQEKEMRRSKGDNPPISAADHEDASSSDSPSVVETAEIRAPTPGPNSMTNRRRHEKPHRNPLPSGRSAVVGSKTPEVARPAQPGASSSFRPINSEKHQTSVRRSSSPVSSRVARPSRTTQPTTTAAPTPSWRRGVEAT